MTVTYVEMKQFQRVDSLVVHLNISGIGSQGDVEAAMARLMGRLVVRDSTGRKTLGLPMLAKHFEIASLDPRDYRSFHADARMLEDAINSGADPTRWVALFAVPAQAQGFTLLIANPDRKEGQAGNVSVELSR